MEVPSLQSGDSEPIVCPQCGGTIEPAGGSQTQCPHCGADLLAPADAEPQVIAEGENPAEEEDDELSALRIRHIAALRRGAYRERSHCVIGAVVLLVGAMKLVLMTVQSVRAWGWHLLPIGFAVAAVVALMIAWWLIGRVKALTAELKRPLLTDPVEPPDFSTLSDGSQHARHLEEM